MGIIDRYLQKRGFVKAEDIKQKAAGFMAAEGAGYPEGKPDQDKIADYPTFIRAYSQLPWLYAGGLAIAIGSTKPALKVLRETTANGEADQEEVTGQPINALVEQPNPDTSWRELIQITTLNLSLLGNGFWNLVGTQENRPISKANPPVEIWWVKPQQMQPKTDKNGAIIGWEFTGPSGQKRTLDPSEIIHFRMPNPGSYFMGMGALSPLSKTATLELNAMSFQDAFLTNDGMPPFLFTKGIEDKAKRNLFWDAWDARHKGPKKGGRAGMIWGDMDVKPLGGTMKDAQYVELRKMNREETLAALPGSVPPSIVGLLEYANYSNMEVQSRKFWEDCEMPILGIVADKMSGRLPPFFDERLWFEFDFSGIKVLQEDEERRARINRLRLGCGEVTPNQLRKEKNQDPYPGGDSYYIDFALAPIGEDGAAAPAAVKRLKKAARKDEEEKPKASYWSDPERKKRLWESFDKRVAAQERAFEPLVRKYLEAQADEVKAKVEAYKTPQEIRPDEVFDVEAEAQLYGEKFEGRYLFAFERAGEAGYHASKGKLWIPPEERRIKDDDTFTVRPEHVAELKAQIGKAARFFNETTWKVVETEINDALAKGLTVEEAAQEIWKSLGERATYEARRIARTEMGRTENWGGIEGYKQNEYVDMKGWLPQPTEDSREAHLAADGQEVRLDDDFTVGGEQLAYPGDPRGSAGNIINCNCTTYPVVGEL